MSIDGPFADAAARAQEAIAAGFTIYQKFTCQGCGARNTMEKPNTFFKQGTCEDCGRTTKIEECGFMAVGGVSLDQGSDD